MNIWKIVKMVLAYSLSFSKDSHENNVLFNCSIVRSFDIFLGVYDWIFVGKEVDVESN